MREFRSGILLPASTTGAPSARAPHGVAPTSPTNGDIWTTSASGLQIRVNGATKTMADLETADQIFARRKIFKSTNNETSLIARDADVSSTFIVEAQNNAGTSRLWGVSAGLGILHDALTQIRPVLPADAGNQNRSSQIVSFYSAYWNGSASTDDPIQLYNVRSSATAKNMDLFIANGGVLITPTTDHIGLRVLRGTDSSPTQAIQQWNNAANNTQLAAIDQNGKFVGPAASTSTASINLPPGSAPTSPAAGDAWTTSTGVFARVNSQNAALINIEPYVFSDGRSTLTTGTGNHRIYLLGNYVVESIQAAVGTAPTGASLIVDVNKNGTTLYTTQSARPTISASGFSSTTTAPAVTTFASGDYITVDIDQVGSTIAGGYLTVIIRLRRLA